MTKFDPQTLDPRQAYRVKRYHTWTMNSQQTNGEHCIQVWRILKAIWPDAPARVLEHALTHDTGERAVGDPPYPTKSSNITLKTMLDDLESSAHLAMCLPWSYPPPVKLDGWEHEVFKLAEYIEMWEHALDELTLGNRGARIVAQNMAVAIALKLEKLSDDSGDFVIRASQYLATRARYYENVTWEKTP